MNINGLCELVLLNTFLCYLGMELTALQANVWNGFHDDNLIAGMNQRPPDKRIRPLEKDNEVAYKERDELAEEAERLKEAAAHQKVPSAIFSARNEIDDAMASVPALPNLPVKIQLHLLAFSMKAPNVRYFL
jgi:hypothetical protein